jgi:hypothetical protein
MINYKHILRFLSKPSIKLSIEEYLFLLTVKFQDEEKIREDYQEIVLYAELYYEQNCFYGTEFFKGREVKFIHWNMLIDKLVQQEYLVDYRTEEEKEKVVNNLWDKLEVTELFKNKIWSNEKDKCWEEVVNLVTTRVGSKLQLPNGSSQDYFSISNADFVKNLEQLKNYWWVEICNNGDNFSIHQFMDHLDYYIDVHGLQMKFVTFISNYVKGIFKTRIIKEMEEAPENSQYKRY